MSWKLGKYKGVYPSFVEKPEWIEEISDILEPFYEELKNEKSRNITSDGLFTDFALTKVMKDEKDHIFFRISIRYHYFHIECNRKNGIWTYEVKEDGLDDWCD